MKVIVTGAGKGIGFQTVKSFSEMGYNILALSRSEDNLRELVRQCEDYSGKVTPFPFDLEYGSFEDLKKVLENEIKHTRIKIIVNNAGVLINKSFTDLSDFDINTLINVNLLSPIKLIRAALPFMDNPSHIVNIGSMGGFQGSVKFPGLSVYSAAKAAIASLSESLALEFKEQNVSVNCLALGAVDTEMLKAAFPNYKAPVSASDMGAFITDFALKGSKYFNGKILPVSLTSP
jgi:short-subunit dehydrogenase